MPVPTEEDLALWESIQGGEGSEAAEDDRDNENYS